MIGQVLEASTSPNHPTRRKENQIAPARGSKCQFIQGGCEMLYIKNKI